MPIQTKTLQEIQQLLFSSLVSAVNNGQTDIKKQIDPNIRNSLISGLVSSLSAGIDDNNSIIKEVLRQLFPQTATGDYLKFWGNMIGLVIKTSQKSTGYINIVGSANTEIIANTTLQKADGTQYKTITTTTLATQLINITTLERVGTTAIATTTSDHNLATGMQIVIAGANQLDYNKTATIIATESNKFTYQVDNAPITPATGSITATATFSKIQVVCDTAGTLGNITSGTQLQLTSPIENVNDIAFTSFEGVFGGIDDETEDNFRVRVLEAWSNNLAPFTNKGIEIFLINQISAITRVWVFDATPNAGQTTIYFVNDGEINILPNSIQLNEAKTKIIDTANGGIKPANMNDNAVIVLSPIPYTINFNFSSLTPNTPQMKEAIKSRLTDYFRSIEVSLGKDISEATYNNVIYSAIDSQGKSLSAFTLTSPIGDIDITSNQLPILGDITF